MVPNKGELIFTLINGRKLLQATNTQSMQVSNIPQYANGPQPSYNLPPLMIPIIFHVTLFR